MFPDQGNWDSIWTMTLDDNLFIEEFLQMFLNFLKHSLRYAPIWLSSWDVIHCMDHVSNTICVSQVIIVFCKYITVFVQ